MPRATTRTAALKMYPRLATPKKPQPLMQFGRPIENERRKTLPAAEPREVDRDHVRAHLLRMILSNEQARRDGQRPNAS